MDRINSMAASIQQWALPAVVFILVCIFYYYFWEFLLAINGVFASIIVISFFRKYFEDEKNSLDSSVKLLQPKKYFNGEEQPHLGNTGNLRNPTETKLDTVQKHRKDTQQH